MVYLVASSVKGKPPYSVEAHDGGKWWSCTCGDWVHRKRAVKGRCKHIDAVIAHNKEQERLQEQAAKMFEHGSGIDWMDDSSESEAS